MKKDYNFKLSAGNSKLGNIVNINLPAIVTCREDAPCKKDCYACKGMYCWKNVKNRYKLNLEAFLEDKERTKQEILEQLPSMGFCRVHSSGDFVNLEYLNMLVEIAKTATEVKFMAFTKKYELVNEWIKENGKLPENFKIIFSSWYDGWTFDNPYDLPVSHVYNDKIDNKVPESALPCPGKCDKCFMCWKLGSGESVVFNKH